jgi:trimethylamine:corrinoid methyltransferase-like protein
MPIMGITAPCDPIATYTLAMAECIGGAVILNELLPTARISMCPHPEPADMRTGSMVMGTPEWELLDIMHRDVFAYYGQARDTKMLHTTAPVPGAQAAADHAAGALSGMLVGLRLFGPIGQLSLDEVFSPAMLLLDMDIVKHAQRIAEGVETGEGLDLDRLPSVVEEVVAGGDIFGAHETSVTNARKQYSAARTMKRRNLAQWRQHGHPCVVKEAYVEAERLVSRYAYVAPADTLNELRRIYDRAQADLK